MTASEPRPQQSRPLNVMFLITSMPVGGAETLLVNLVRRMDPARFRPQICCLKERGPLGDEIADEIPVHSQFTSGKFDVRVLGRLKRLFKREEIDAVVTVGAGDKMFWGRLAARQARVPVVLSALHSTGWPDGVGRLNRMLTGITDGFIAVAEPHGEFLVEFEKFPASKVHVIPNGIDTERFQFDAGRRQHYRNELGISENAPVCGIVAALRPEKNHMLFLHTAALVLKELPEAHFLIVGDGPQRELLETSSRDFGLSDRVHFTGSCSDIPGILSAIDIFALTSHNEANPVSILEAMSVCRPVVATDVGSVSQSVMDGENGFMVEPGDAQTMSKRWLELLCDSKRCRNFGEAARAHVEKIGSLQVMVDGYQSLISQIFEARMSRRKVGQSGMPSTHSKYSDSVTSER